MFKKIELKEGWIVRNSQGEFLSRDGFWVKGEARKAFVHETDIEDLISSLEDLHIIAQSVLPAMVFNGHILLGKPAFLKAEEEISRN